MSYAEGFEDAIELCLHEIRECDCVDKARMKIELLSGLVKERKFDRIKSMLLSL